LTEHFTESTNNCDNDGQHDNTENSRCSTTTTQVDTPQLNGSAVNDDCYFVIRKFSTLPRVKSRESFTRRENGAGKSRKLSSRSNENDEQEVTKLDDTLSDSVTKVNKKSDKMLFQCTTLPTRSRLSEAHFRQSLRQQSIDLSDNLRKHSSEQCSEGNNATLIVLPTASGSQAESTSGTGKLNNRQTANCVYVHALKLFNADRKKIRIAINTVIFKILKNLTMPLRFCIS
jgi:hypothetical protein